MAVIAILIGVERTQEVDDEGWDCGKGQVSLMTLYGGTENSVAMQSGTNEDNPWISRRGFHLQRIH